MSGKSHKYEYLTGEEILPSNKQQIIEQANLLIGPCNYNDYNDKDSPLILKQKEIFNKLAKERFNKINELDKKVDIDDLVYRYKGEKWSPDEKFDKYDNALDLINKIRNGEIKFSIAKNDQTIFKSHLDKTRKGNNKKRLKDQRNTLYNIEMLYKARNEAIKFYDDYSLMASEAKIKQTIKQRRVRDLKY